MIVDEHTNHTYTATLKDAAGAVIPASAITSLTLTLYELKSGTILNSRDAVDVKNANNGTIDENGLFTMEFQPTDNVRVGTVEHETHVALFQYEFGSSRRGSFERTFVVKKITKVTAV